MVANDKNYRIVRVILDPTRSSSDSSSAASSLLKLATGVLVGTVVLASGFIVSVLSANFASISAFSYITEPAVILVTATVFSLMLLFLGNLSSTSSTKIRPFAYGLFSALMVSLTIVLSLIVFYQTISYSKQSGDNGMIVANVIILVYQAISFFSICLCLAIRGLLNKFAKGITRRVHWMLYVMAFLLTLPVPILSICGLLFDAQVLLNSHILTVAAILFAAAAFIHVFGHWFNEDISEDGSISKRDSKDTMVKIIKLLILLSIMTALLAFAAWAISYYTIRSESHAYTGSLIEKVSRYLKFIPQPN
ncbi:hypothetical protein NEHOM01_0154 [Nematocida homosporus]|uniref:uncharacterized protein n=1 Tax=Nematocida homosporus TaxID=1912981 RepID=UPI002220DCAF|nr:uncharacterized protein NEHOM01_0154 [Nematocida homosporus]KAI5184409.1 hypothetical protein NEHOM01_0154 [Nematocida homosporus]